MASEISSERDDCTLMNPEDDPLGNLVPGIASFSEEINKLKSEMEDMRMQIDILKETINVIKKDPGVDQEVLWNRKKAVIIGALISKYSLPNLLAALRCPRSSYYYQQGHKAARQILFRKRTDTGYI